MTQGNHPDHPPVEGGYRGTNGPLTNVRDEIDKAHLVIFLTRCAVLSGSRISDLDQPMKLLTNWTSKGLYWNKVSFRCLVEHFPFAAKVFAEFYCTTVSQLGKYWPLDHEGITRVVRARATHVAKELNQLFQKTAADRGYVQYKSIYQSF